MLGRVCLIDSTWDNGARELVVKIFGSWNQRLIYIKMKYAVKLRCLTELRQCWLEGRKFSILFLVYPNDGIAILR